MRKNKKKVLAGVLAALLAFVAVGGTIAWLTAQSSLTNSFTVGGITDPENKPDPDNPNQPGDDPLDPDDSDKDKLDGNLYESDWVPGSALKPGASVDKNPNVGIGPESENAYVFLYVENATVKEDTENAKTPFFNLNDNWAGVAALDGTHTYGATASNAAEKNEKSFVSGLFMYSGNGTDPSVLKASEIVDSWTGTAFDDVIVPAATELDDFVEVNEASDPKTYPEMKVYSFVYACDATESNGDDALAAARQWAAQLAGNTE